MNESQKYIINGIINNLSMLLSGEDIGTREILTEKDELKLLSISSIEINKLYYNVLDKSGKGLFPA
jgi:hypothetical protein